LVSSYLAIPGGQAVDSPPSLWITGVAANPYRLRRVGNCR